MSLPRLFQTLFLLIFCSLITACQSVSPTVNHPAAVPQETPAAAPTEIGSWPLSPDGHLMVAQTKDGSWWMWDAPSQRPVYLLNDTTLHVPSLRHPTFSPDGRYLAAISVGHVLLWEVATRKRRLLMLPTGKEYRSMRWLVFSPDSQLLATSACEKRVSRSTCAEGYVNLWNTKDGTLAHALPVGFRVDAMTYSADGSTLSISGCSQTDTAKGSYCYEKTQMTYQVASGGLIALTRIPQFQ
jgi:WD40 repeat protein